MVGTSSKHDISAYLKEIGQYKAFGSVNFITPLKGLTVPECFIRKLIHAVRLRNYAYINLVFGITVSLVGVTNQFTEIN